MHLLTIEFENTKLTLIQEGDRVKAIVGESFFYYGPETNKALLTFLVDTNKGLKSILSENRRTH